MIGTIGALAPFVGLFGTVVGIMIAFDKFRESGGKGGISSVSGDIAEALVVTAAGILVALTSVVLYNYFNQRLAAISMELKMQCQEFSESLTDCLASEQDEPKRSGKKKADANKGAKAKVEDGD